MAYHNDGRGVDSGGVQCRPIYRLAIQERRKGQNLCDRRWATSAIGYVIHPQMRLAINPEKYTDIAAVRSVADGGYICD